MYKLIFLLIKMKKKGRKTNKRTNFRIETEKE